MISISRNWYILLVDADSVIWENVLFLSWILNRVTVVFFHKCHNNFRLFYMISLCKENLNICIFHIWIVKSPFNSFFFFSGQAHVLYQMICFTCFCPPSLNKWIGFIFFIYKYAVHISMFSAVLWCISHFMRAVADLSVNKNYSIFIYQIHMN